MDAREAIKVGEQIALKHKRSVLEILELGATPEKALDGCIVSLAADIMVALNREGAIKPHEADKPPLDCPNRLDCGWHRLAMDPPDVIIHACNHPGCKYMAQAAAIQTTGAK